MPSDPGREKPAGALTGGSLDNRLGGRDRSDGTTERLTVLDTIDCAIAQDAHRQVVAMVEKGWTIEAATEAVVWWWGSVAETAARRGADLFAVAA